MINHIVLSGRLTKEPEFRTLPNGTNVTTFNLAVQRNFKNQNNEYDADFFNCVVFGNKAQNFAQYVAKGNIVNVAGRLQSRSYENQNGQRVFVTEVICNDYQLLPQSNNIGGNNNGQNFNNGSNQQYNNYQNSQNTQKGRKQPNDWQQKQQQNNFNNQQAGNPFANTNGNDPLNINDEDLPF